MREDENAGRSRDDGGEPAEKSHRKVTKRPAKTAAA